MDCRELEERLEALLDGELDESERRRCSDHFEHCAACRELTEPFAVATSPPADLVGSVLARTSGSPCGRAGTLLCDWLDDQLGGAERELMAAHLDSCTDCRALAAAMSRLAVELPRLAELPPEPGFVAAVLAATLPLDVRLRRWWLTVWPQWVRRPRFASEAAFVATLALVLVFATPGSPLAAVPTKAFDLARSDPRAHLEAPAAALEEGFETQVREPLSRSYGRGEAMVLGWVGAAEAKGKAMASETLSRLGTYREMLASLLGSADDKASDSDDTAENPNQETS